MVVPETSRASSIPRALAVPGTVNGLCMCGIVRYSSMVTSNHVQRVLTSFWYNMSELCHVELGSAHLMCLCTQKYALSADVAASVPWKMEIVDLSGCGTHGSSAMTTDLGLRE